MEYREALEHLSRCSDYSSNCNTSTAKAVADNKDTAKKSCTSSRHKCPNSHGTISRIFIPAGATFNYLNMVEAMSPSGISLIVRLPFVDGKSADISENIGLTAVIDALRAAGVAVEIEED